MRTDETGAVVISELPAGANNIGDVNTFSGELYSTRLDEASATITYVGFAAPASATSSAVWRIKRLDSTSGLVVLYADGNASFDNIWDNRAALSYS